MGERTPHLDAQARGGWIGLTAKHARADLVRSVIEGVSYSLRDCLQIVERLGVSVDSVRASGGGAKSAFWRQLLADIMNKRVVTLATQEGSAYGAALLAVAGTSGCSVVDVCRTAIKEIAAVAPGADTAYYERGYPVFQSLYPALKAAYGQIAEL
jgi:xylulokinase